MITFSFSDIDGWGPPTEGRGILLSIYFAILAVSVALLNLHTYYTSYSNRDASRHQATIEHMVAALLITQILYKITTPITAGWTNPVVISNLCISVLHGITLYFQWQEY